MGSAKLVKCSCRLGGCQCYSVMPRGKAPAPVCKWCRMRLHVRYPSPEAAAKAARDEQAWRELRPLGLV